MQMVGDQRQQLLTARQVQQLLRVDRSTVYRMAGDGRLPSIRVGKQLRFPSERILAMLEQGGTQSSHNGPRVAVGDAPDSELRVDDGAVGSLLRVGADLLGVMMVVTDMAGRPVTDVVNQCPWFREHSGDADTLAACLAEWRSMAEDVDLAPRFQQGSLGFECARVFIRSGPRLVGMVLAGGVAPPSSEESGNAGAQDTPPHPADGSQLRDGLYHLDDEQRRRVVDGLPKIAAAMAGSVAPAATGVAHVAAASTTSPGSGHY